MDESFDALVVRIDADTSGLRRELQAASRLSSQFGRALTGAFEDAALRGKGLGDVLRALALDFAKIALRAALSPVTNAIGQAFSGLFAFAKGGVVARGAPVPFASGGVVTGPLSFAMAGGRQGLMGEAGPEAILPLARGSDGRLGVRAEARSAPAITVHIHAQDAQSVLRAEGEIAVAIARASARAERNL